MKVNFKYLGLPKKELKNEVKTIEVQAADVRALLDKISKEYKVSKEIFKGCYYMVNNKKADLDTKLKDGDYVLITKSLGGG